MNRKISLSIEDIYIKYAGEAFGATGSHNALTLRMIFGSAWDGTAKTAYFTDALGSASVSIVLGLDKLVGGAYEIDVPSEALKYAGEATVTIKGVLTSGDTTTKAITTAAGHFRVLDSELPESAGNVGTITPSDKEQLQAEIAGLENLFTTTKTAAETAAANAKASEDKAKASEESAGSSATAAEASKTAAAGSAATAAEKTTAASDSASKAAASQTAAKSSEDKAKASETAAESAKTAAEAAKAEAAESAESASASAQTAQSAASSAGAAASTASSAASAASGSASDAVGSAAAAAQSAASVAGINKTAESWAVGGTGTREGENTNNAKYWANQAQAVVGGDFATKTEAQGYVADHNQSATAHSDIREAVSKAGKAFVITGTLGDDGETIAGINKTRAEVRTAVQENRVVKVKIAPYELTLGNFFLQEYRDDYAFFALENRLGLIAALYLGDAESSGELFEVPIPGLSDNMPSSPGTDSPGTSEDAARADHVHPSEVLRVGITSDVDLNCTSSATAAEIYAAFRAGKYVFAQYGGRDYTLYDYTTDSSGNMTQICFHSFSTVGVGREFYIRINADDTILLFNSNDLVMVGDDGKIPSRYLPEISSVKTYTATIGTTWTEDSNTGVKTQNVAIPGVLASHTAKVDHAYTGSGTSEDYAAFVEAENQYLNCITNGYAETYNGGVKFTIFGDANTVSIPIVVEVA